MNPMLESANAYAKAQMDLVLTLLQPSFTLGESRAVLENRISGAWIEGYIQGIRAGMTKPQTEAQP